MPSPARLLLLLLLAAAILRAQPDSYKLGHSYHGEAFDAGPREKPWVMEGIGKTHFPITTSKPEVQQWFDQGHTLLHSFWYYEAERAFRWALKLDPDCAMCYWGLSRSVDDEQRGRAFFQEAIKRKDKVSERERLYLEAWEQQEHQDKFRSLLEKLILKYPGDIEAKALFVIQTLGGPTRLGNELVLQQVLAKDPRHPGAHHYRIHNWDSPEGDYALDSCRLYGEIVPGIGHAQHMPGHIYSRVGMWHEAAISMDTANRVEAGYMKRRLIFPFNDWNYAHNRAYLSYIQEQLGMPDRAIRGARLLLAAPLDPKYNRLQDNYRTRGWGMSALVRGLIRFERWKEILDPKTFPWGDTAWDKIFKAYCEAQAHIGLGNLDKAATSIAAHSALKSEVEKPDSKWLEQTYTIQSLEIHGLLSLAKGEVLTGLGTLSDAAKREFEMREKNNDPPRYPTMIYNTLGRAYLAQKSPALAVTAFEKALEAVRDDGFALSGLVEAYVALGEKEKARDALSRLLFVWSDAEPGLKWFERAKSFELDAKPRDGSPAPQRNYVRTSLEYLGPDVWEPYEAPQLDAVDAQRKRVTLEGYRGRNVLLIFYLKEECPHCMEQLQDVAKRRSEFAQLDTDVLAVSSEPPEKLAVSQKLGELSFRLLSDVKQENARRFKSYDDFEDLALHSTILIDKRGRVHWARNGGDPFKDFDFLLKEIKRINN